MKNNFILFCIFCILPFIIGCGATVSQLKARAAFDLGCPESEITIVDIDKRTKGVMGCGKKATYVENCDGPIGPFGAKSGCTWILNTDTVEENRIDK